MPGSNWLPVCGSIPGSTWKAKPGGVGGSHGSRDLCRGFDDRSRSPGLVLGVALRSGGGGGRGRALRVASTRDSSRRQIQGRHLRRDKEHDGGRRRQGSPSLLHRRRDDWARANIGAGSITCNYDGYEKHRTEIGERAFIGSDTMLVAPVVIGDGAFTGAGSVITVTSKPGALAVERSHQKEIPGYAARREERHRARHQKTDMDVVSRSRMMLFTGGANPAWPTRWPTSSACVWGDFTAPPSPTARSMSGPPSGCGARTAS